MANGSKFEANILCVVTECASPTPLETLTPDVVLVPIEVNLLHCLYISEYPQQR